ncbi:MAG: hypothetical protein KDD43_01435 [Bdellovibrionales bacterium]|nr:hypothetical protein [Bdellovibrionales bacterium]
MNKTHKILLIALLTLLGPCLGSTALGEPDDLQPYVEEPLGAIEESQAGRDKNECGECSRHFRDDQLARGDNPRQVTDRVARVLSGEGATGNTGTKSTK